MRTSKAGQSDSRKGRQEALGKVVERPASSRGCPYRSRWRGKAWKQPLWKGSVSAELELPILTVRKPPATQNGSHSETWWPGWELPLAFAS